MTARSQNGWSANDAAVSSSRLVPGTSVRLTVRNGAAGNLLLAVAAAFDRDVQDIDNARGALDDWGYAERPIRGSATELSNHASGTAVDLNATRWALGSPASVNLNPTQIAAVRRIVAATGGVVRWGGDYTGRKDPMHFEINDGRTEADCLRAIAQLTGTTTAAPTAAAHQEDDVSAADVWNAPIDDAFTAKPDDKMPAASALAWATAHAAFARRDAAAALAAVQRVEAKLDQLLARK